MKDSIFARRSYGAPFLGFGYFVSRPYLWWKPFFTAAFSWILLFILFVVIAYVSWPMPAVDTPWYKYAWDIFHSFALASIIVLMVWTFLLPIILNIALEKMICLVYRELGTSFFIQTWRASIFSSLVVLCKTSLWRIFWPLLTLASLFYFSPLSIVLAQIGIGHIAVLDASDLSLSLLGYSSKDRISLIRRFKISLLIAGISAGTLSLILLTTIMGWIFWLPGVYIGLALFWKTRISFISAKEKNKRSSKFLSQDFSFQD